MRIYNESGQEIPWEYNEFPDGQLQIKIKKEYVSCDEFGYVQDDFDVEVSLPNPSIFNLFSQLATIVNIRNLSVKYLYGARSDKDESGDYFVANVAEDTLHFLSSCCINLEIIAPHCDTSELCNNYFKANFEIPDCLNLDNYDVIIFPDKSAKKRFSFIDKPFVVCEKERDQESGKIVKHIIPQLPAGTKSALVIDDLCDAGGTYLNLMESKEISELPITDLFIFHGVFTNNALGKLVNCYDNIFVSNSLPNAEKQKEELGAVGESGVSIFNVWR